MLTYEQRLSADGEWALQEGSMHFDQNNSVFEALHKITARLEALGIRYAVVGGMSMFLHGYRRFTEDVALLVTRESLTRIHEGLEGRGYLPPFAGSEHLRDAEYGVKVEFLVTGDYPGDGKPKPVAFPDPASSSVEIERVRVLRLDKVIELKLASGLTNPTRLKDLADVQELIATLKLPGSIADQLDPSVREKYREFWRLHADNPPAEE
jgi:hypothetical protein